ncbi:hypothetical protein PR048_025301 [Dryococelus australis]|uniref:Uncharacterized protein n=1 Tax=Dryococelus australis TaxID=614101 RepID=A0ABQ9GQZ3_9NEOP|nr:hypothetical protein PR048_025301 [Dryococelus australis]
MMDMLLNAIMCKFLNSLTRMKSHYYASLATRHIIYSHWTELYLNLIQFGELLGETWGNTATPENAIAGFRATRIHPFNVDAIPDFAFVVNPRPSENENCEPAPDSLLETNL